MSGQGRRIDSAPCLCKMNEYDKGKVFYNNAELFQWTAFDGKAIGLLCGHIRALCPYR